MFNKIMQVVGAFCGLLLCSLGTGLIIYVIMQNNYTDHNLLILVLGVGLMNLSDFLDRHKKSVDNNGN